MSNTYVNFDGQVMLQSAAPTVWINTTAAGQTLTATSAASTQLGDQYGGTPTLIGGGGGDTFDILDSTTKVIETSAAAANTVSAWCNFVLPTNVANLNLEVANLTGTGNGMGDLMIAMGLHDTLIAGTGEDVMVDYGPGGDTFSFSANSYRDTIVGFQTSGATHDTIKLVNCGYATFAQVQAHMTQVGADVVLTLPGTTAITIRGVKVAALTASDFSLPTSVTHTVSAYANYNGAALSLSASPTVVLSATSANQAMTAAAGVNTQFSDQHSYGGTYVGDGTGDDRFFISNSNTQIVEAVNTGVDTVYAYCNYTMAANLKVLNLESVGVTGVANSLGDLVIAYAQGDTLVGGTGLDVLVDNGAGGDTFAFNTAGNHDVVVGFQASGTTHDTLQVGNFGFTTFAQMKTHLSQVGADTLLTLSSTDSVLIRNMKVASLTASDFSFGSPSTSAHATSTYTNYSGAMMYLSGSSAVVLSATSTVKTLVATQGVNTQFSDQLSTGGVFVGSGTGDDQFYISKASTQIIEGANTGVDSVYAWCNYTMAANLKDLTLETAGVTGVANSQGDLIIALGKGDTLTGGTGLDVLVDGGAGGDTFTFNAAGDHDVVMGFAASGSNHDVLNVANFGYSTFAQAESHLSQVGADTLLTLSSSDAVLIRGVTVASLTAADFSLAAPTITTQTIASAATSSVASTTGVTVLVAPVTTTVLNANYLGQALHASAAPTVWLSTTSAGQTLTAGSAPTQLSDQLGGAPTLIGGSGDDTFNILDPNTTIVVSSTKAVDTVQAWCNYTLPANVQNLTIEGAHSTGVGNSGGNLLIANGLNDTLVGGSGSDVLVDGGAGSDVFSFSTGGGHDVISGFQASGNTHDFIQLTNYGFSSFAQVQSHLTQVGSDTLLTLSANDAIVIRNTTVSSLTASDFLLQLDTSQMTMTFDGEFNSLSLYNSTTGEGVWKTNFISGAQASSGAQAYTSRTLTGNAEQEIYVDPSYQGTGTTALGLNPFSISNGVLTITASKTPTADLSALSGYQYTSGLLTTEKSFSQLYGYFEIKAELPTGQGVWPAFWLLPENGNWPPEIDTFEAVGGNKIYQTTHTDSTGTATATAFTTDLTNVSNTFHTYGVLWTAQNIDYYIDGVEVASMATPSDMNKPMYMLVNLAIGGNWPGDASASFTSAQMKVDYVHAYSLSSSAATAAQGATTVYVASAAADTVPTTADTVQSAFSFSLAGSGAHNLVLTGSGNVNATGNNLGDSLTGNAGTNVLTGGTGADTITAGAGAATLTGGGGTDTFVFNVGAAHDVITDFSGHDVLDISSYLKAGYTPTVTDSGANVTLTFSTGASIELLGVHSGSLISTSLGFTH